MRNPKINNMYPDTKSWNPAVGCLYNCVYCQVSYQRLLKRRKNACKKCYDYIPHVHPERLAKIPSAQNIFVCSTGDISFCPLGYTWQIIDAIKTHKRCSYKTYYFQSKNPIYLKPFISPPFSLPENVILLTTLETNRSDNYWQISKASLPSQRFVDFSILNYPRKGVTIEPIMDFDLGRFIDWIRIISPEFVYVGFNSRPRAVQLPEPPVKKVKELITELKKFVEIRLKDLRGLKI